MGHCAACGRSMGGQGGIGICKNCGSDKAVSRRNKKRALGQEPVRRGFF